MFTVRPTFSIRSLLLTFVLFSAAFTWFSNRPSQGLSVELQQARAELGEIVITFTNESHKGLGIVKPLDGSFSGTYQPYYWTRLTDPAGRCVPQVGACGHEFGFWGDRSWPDDYIVYLKPGESLNLELPIVFSEYPPGECTLSFQYACVPFVPDSPINSRLWQGILRARDIEVRFAPSGSPTATSVAGQ